MHLHASDEPLDRADNRRRRVISTMSDLFRFKSKQAKEEEEDLQVNAQTSSFFQAIGDVRPVVAQHLKDHLFLQTNATSLKHKAQKAGIKSTPKININNLEDPQPPKQGVQNEPESQTRGFGELNLCKQLIKATNQAGFIRASPIQQLVIPAVQSGKDVFGLAHTGTGKTAAFLLPILHRYFRAPYVNYIRCLIMVPTRQLALQCYNMFSTLNKYTKVECGMAIGGGNMKHEEIQLRNHPCILIGTPGRVVDHLLNSKNITIQNLQVLVLDQADKLLELGFEKQIKQILQSAGEKVQTLMFSATVGDSLKQLIKLSMRKPIRLSANPDNSTVRKLAQKIYRLKQDTGQQRQAVLLALASGISEKTIVFFKTKHDAHRMATVLTLAGLNPVQLHSNLSQTQRVQSFQAFNNGSSNIMLATDLAARGLDIRLVKFVINYQVPNELVRYIHRIGRTARAGQEGTSITICSDSQTLLMKRMIRKTGDTLTKIMIDPKQIENCKRIIQGMQGQINDIKRQQNEETQLRRAEMQLKRAQNIVNHHKDIAARPRKEWIATPKEKRLVRQASRRKYQEGDMQQEQQISYPRKKVK